MRTICIPHFKLPGATALHTDYLYEFPRVDGFYQHSPHAPEALRRAAAAAQQMPGERRQRVAAALRELNGANPSLDLLELPGTVAVVTGQQVGLYGGPAYTLYKAITAVRLARQLTGSGIRAVPIFWMATEDHDLAEANQAFVFDRAHQPVKLTAAAGGPPRACAGTVRLESVPHDALAAALEGFPHAEEILDLAAACYAPGRTFGEAFHALLRRLLSGHGVIFLDPLNPALREIAAPFLTEAYRRAPEFEPLLLERNRALVEAGYHAQVLFEPGSSLFFALRDGQRMPAVEAGPPAALSPNALLRPVMQDYLLPTAIYVGGPAELSYFAQSEVLYRALLGRMPVAFPRASFTLLDARGCAMLERYRLDVLDILRDPAGLAATLAARATPPDLAAAFDATAAGVEELTAQLGGKLQAFDPSLAAALATSRRKMLYQVEKNRGKAARAALRRDQRASRAAAHLSGLLAPHGKLQERCYSILPFLAKHGLGLVDMLAEEVWRSCPDHLLIAL